MILIAFIFAGFLGALNATLTKLSVIGLSPTAVVASRFFLASMLILPFAIKNGSFKKINKNMYVINSLFALNATFFALGIGKTSLMVSQIMYVQVPLIVAILGYFFLKEKLSKNGVIGLMITISGMILLVARSLKTSDVTSFGTPIGNLLIFFAVLSWSSYIVFSKRVSKIYSPLKITLFNFLATAILSFAITLIGFHTNISQTPAWVYVAIAALSATTVGFFFTFQWVIKHTSAFISSLIIYIAPMFASVLGIVIFNEKINSGLALGSALVIFGVFWATSLEKAKIYIGKYGN